MKNYKWILIIAFFCFSFNVFAGKHQSSSNLGKAIGQMMMVGFKGTTINVNSPIVIAIREYHIGGVILLPYDTKNGKSMTRNISNPKQLKRLVKKTALLCSLFS